MELKGLHFLLTYKRDSECDHCFVWSTPDSKGTFTISQIRTILAEEKKLGSAPLRPKVIVEEPVSRDTHA